MYALHLAEMILLILALLVVWAVMVIHAYYILRNRVPYVVLPAGAMAQVAEELGVIATDKVMDLGCGDGRVLRYLHKAEPGARYTGVENNLLVWWAARVLSPGIKIMRGDIEETPLQDVTKLFCYLGPTMMQELEPRFERELPKGARVASVQFALPHRKPDKVVELTDSAKHAAKLYIYNY